MPLIDLAVLKRSDFWTSLTTGPSDIFTEAILDKDDCVLATRLGPCTQDYLLQPLEQPSLGAFVKY